MEMELEPTEEQEAILDAFVDGGPLAISAGAGTGKTSTLRMLARSRPGARGLYVAYNKAIQEEAKRSFPRSVECRTAHSLAWGAFGQALRDRMDGARMPTWEVARVIGARGVPIGRHGLLAGPEVARLALATVERFCHSASSELDPSHFVPPPVPRGTDVGALGGEVLRLAGEVWSDYSAESGKLRITHDVYLKLWQLSGPDLAYDYILLDEAQDADPAIADVVGRQGAQIVAVGDNSQAIFGWRGSTSVLDAFGRGRKLHLTRSFRFGPEIAAEANLWLDLLGADMRLSGSPVRTSALGAVRSPRAILCRTNAGTIGAAMDVQARGARVALAGGGKEIAALADAAAKMQAGRRTSHPDLVAFSDWDEVRAYAEEDPGGSDLAVAVKLIDTYGAERITVAIAATVPEERAHTVISTAHKAKGREWSSVRVSGDFPGPRIDKNGQPLPIPRPDAMLAYVTVTRAMERLDASALSWVHTHGLRCAAERPPLSAVPSPAGPDGRSEPAEPPAARAPAAAEAEGASLLEIPLDDELEDALATLTMNGATRAYAARRAILAAASRRRAAAAKTARRRARLSQ